MLKSHKIKLYPTKKQEEFFIQSCGVARFSYNWGLDRWQELYNQGVNTSAYSLIKELTSIKNEEFPWMLSSGKCAPQYAIHNLEKAYKRFFNKISDYPKYKKKGKKESFVAVDSNVSFKQSNKKIWIPKLGNVKCSENFRFNNCTINSVTIIKKASYWFAVISANCISNPVIVPSIYDIVGVDLGIKFLAITSEGEEFKNPKSLNKYSKSLKRQQRFLSRKIKGSNNRKKQIKKVGKIHYKISNIRGNALNQATTKIVNSASTIVLEDLNVKGMLKNHKLSQALLDVSLSEFRRQIEYKAKWQNKEVIIADRFYPSSKTCSCCGNIKKELQLKDRIFNCNSCGFSLDRDLNAAKNLANYGSREKSSQSNASGVDKNSL